MTIVDITQRKSAEKELLESEERFRVLHNASFGGIAIHDQGIILDCNQGLGDVSGLGMRDLVGADLLMLVAEKDREKVSSYVGAPSGKILEVSGVRGDGSAYPVRVESRNIPYKGRTVQVVEFRDITVRKQAEEFMLQNEKMMSVGGLAAGMAHEINNPLATIVGGAQNLQLRMLRENDINDKTALDCGVSIADVQTYVKARGCDKIIQSIYDSGVRAADIVKDMLSFSRKSDKILVSSRLDELMEKTITLVGNDYDLKKNYDFRKIDIRREYSEEPVSVACYSNQIQQVFFNVLSNAAHAMAEKKYSAGGPEITVRIYDHNEYGVVEVEDNGSGLSAEQSKKVFEPFYSTKVPGKGTGLGLSVSYFIVVKQHSGSIKVQSTPGKGTKFVISLPRVPK